LISIPLTLIAIHFAIIPFSGSSVNPARSLGPALVGDQWHGFWIYVVGPGAGAIIGWLIYSIVIKGGTDLSDDMKALRRDPKQPSTEPPAATS
jgi:glycerol uptake facilitator-like aquaporin